MTYETPKLIVVGAATELVQGIPGGFLDNGVSETSHPPEGIALGLDE